VHLYLLAAHCIACSDHGCLLWLVHLYLLAAHCIALLIHLPILLYIPSALLFPSVSFIWKSKVTLYSMLWFSSCWHRVSSYTSISRGLFHYRSHRAVLSVPDAGWLKNVRTLKSMKIGIWSLAKIEPKVRIPHTSMCSTSLRDMNVKSICLDPCVWVGGASS
jgi:hypothetical protein